MLKICITGHRDLINSEDVRKDIAHSLQYFKEIDKDLLAISAVAAGSDTLFAEEAFNQHIPLKLMLPFSIEEYRKDFKGMELYQLEKLLSANEYEIVHPQNISTADERNDAYLQTGKRMVDIADIVLAVWNGKPANGKGGTGDIVNYAVEKGKKVHYIKGIRIKKEGEEIEADKAQATFDRMDSEAVKYKKRRFEPAWIAGIIAGILAVISFATGLAFPLPHSLKFVFACCELFFLFASFILLGVYAKKWKNVFLVKRRGAEFLRTVLWYKDAGISIPKTGETDYTPGAEMMTIEKEASESVNKISNIENSKRIAWCLAAEQVNYHQQTRIKRFSEKQEKMEKWLTLTKVIFFTAAPVSFLVEALEHFEIHVDWNIAAVKPFLLFLAITLPPLYAALEGIRYFGEWKRNIAISRKIVHELKKVEDSILFCHDEQTLVVQAKILRQILEIENSDWAIRYEEKEVGSKI